MVKWLKINARISLNNNCWFSWHKIRFRIAWLPNYCYFILKSLLGDQRLYSEREDFCEDFISMVFQLMLVIVYYIYMWVVTKLNILSLFAAQATRAAQLHPIVSRWHEGYSDLWRLNFRRLQHQKWSETGLRSRTDPVGDLLCPHAEARLHVRFCHRGHLPQNQIGSRLLNLSRQILRSS